MSTLIISTDDTTNGGIAKFVKTLDDNIKDTAILLFKRYQIFGYPPFYFFNFIKLIRKVKASNRIFVNDPQFTTIGFLALVVARIYNIPIYFISHGFMFHNKIFFRFKYYYFYVVVRFVHYLQGRIVSVSPIDSKKLKKINFNDFEKIYNGVDFDINVNQNIIKKYKFLCVGRNVPHKRINLFVEFCKVYCNSDVQGVLVTNDFKLDVPDGMSVLSNITDDELSSLYTESEYFISFSTYEGFGLAALEALAHGCIPFLFRNDSFKYIFSDHEELLFDDDTFEVIKSKLDALQSVDISLVRGCMKSKYSNKLMIKSYSDLP